MEVGPAETLTNMARKTLKAGYESHDMATGLKRELLSYKKNTDEIYYKVAASSTSATKTREPAPTVTVTPAVAPIPVNPAPAAMTTLSTEEVSLPDRPLDAIDVLITLVAIALKRPASDVARDQSIKKLCGGKKQ